MELSADMLNFLASGGGPQVAQSGPAAAIKGAINWMCQPEPLFSLSTLAFFLCFWKLEVFAKKSSMIVMMVGIVVYFAVSALDPNFAVILTKPDNVPIIIIFLALPFLFWLWAYQAVENDGRIAEGRPVREIDVEPKVVYVWPHLV